MINIRYKLLAAFLLTIGLIWASSAATLHNGKYIIKTFHDLTDDVIPGAGTMSDMKFQAAKIEAETFEHILGERLILDHEPAKAELYAKHEQIKELSLSHIEHEKHRHPEDLRAAGELSDLIQNVINKSNYIANLPSEDINNSLLLRRLEDDFHKTHHLLESRLNKHLSIHLEELSSGEARIDELNRRNIKTILILSFGISLLVLAIALFVDRLFLKHSRERDTIEYREHYQFVKKK